MICIVGKSTQLVDMTTCKLRNSKSAGIQLKHYQSLDYMIFCPKTLVFITLQQLAIFVYQVNTDCILILQKFYGSLKCKSAAKP